MMATLGVILVVVGAALMVAEAHLPSHGALGTGAAAALTAGVVLALSSAGARGRRRGGGGRHRRADDTGACVVAVAEVADRTPHGVRSGPQALAGRVATVRTVPAPVGQVQLDGALWRARMWELEGEGVPVAEGSAVVVESIDGLTLTVRPAEEWEVR